MNRKYWILENTTKPFDVRNELKHHGAKWNPTHKCWEIYNPSEEVKNLFKVMGLTLQYAKN